MADKPKTTRLGSWMRKVVPPGYAKATLMLTGTAPLLHNSSEYDRGSETYRAYYMLGKKKQKTLDDQARIGELEWTLALYLDEQIGPYIPSRNLHEMLREAATKYRKGADIKRSLIVIDYRVPLLYDGPRAQQELWDGGYRFEAMVSNAGPGSGRVLRTRPMFPDWSLAAEIAYDPEDIDLDFLQVVVERSQKYGLGDYRPTFGSFEATLEPGDLHKLASNGAALKPVVREQLKAHLAFVDRIMQVPA